MLSGRGGVTAFQVDRHWYGADASQYAELYRPHGRARHTVVVLFHGGFWRSAYGADHLAGVAADLAGRGWVVWNAEYRRVGNGGGASETLADASAAVDALAEVAETRARRVVVVGHSAGGHLATWVAGRGAAARAGLGPAPRVEVEAVVSLAGVLDLTRAATEAIGEGATVSFMGGPPEDLPDLYTLADPLARIPIDAVVRCVHARSDQRVPFAQSETYVTLARAAGMDATLIEATGDHFSVVDTAAADWSVVLEVLEGLSAASNS